MRWHHQQKQDWLYQFKLQGKEDTILCKKKCKEISGTGGRDWARTFLLYVLIFYLQAWRGGGVHCKLSKSSACHLQSEVVLLSQNFTISFFRVCYVQSCVETNGAS